MSKRTDISQQIRKYLNGELDAHAMHQLEQEALNDPFLAEALEGYEKAGGDQEQNLSDIHARLQDRIIEKRRRIVLWRTISIAASVLIVLTIGGLWLKNEQPEIKPIVHINKTNPTAPTVKTPPENSIAQQNKKAIPPSRGKKPAINKGYIVVNNGVAQADGGSPPPTVSEINTNELAARNVQKDSSKGNAAVTSALGIKRQDREVGYATAKISANQMQGNTITGIVTSQYDRQPLPGAEVKVKGTSIMSQTDANGKFILKNVPDNLVLDLSYIGYQTREINAHRKDSLLIAMQPDNNALSEVTVVGYGTQKKKDLTGTVADIQPAQVEQKNIVAANSPSGKVAGIQVFKSKVHSVTGTVVAKEDGLPIPGVTVKVKGSKNGTQTNANGQFTINSVPDGSILDIAFIGYTSQQIPVHKKDSLLIAMQESSNQLNEVVVTTAMGISREQEYQSGRPNIGWSGYKKYLKNNALSPDGKTGVVKLSFVVNTNNSLSDFKIIKSVSAKTDSVAIELVKNGPGWLRNTDNTPHKVRLRIPFIKK